MKSTKLGWYVTYGSIHGDDEKGEVQLWIYNKKARRYEPVMEVTRVVVATTKQHRSVLKVSALPVPS